MAWDFLKDDEENVVAPSSGGGASFLYSSVSRGTARSTTPSTGAPTPAVQPFQDSGGGDGANNVSGGTAVTSSPLGSLASAVKGEEVAGYIAQAAGLFGPIGAIAGVGIQAGAALDTAGVYAKASESYNPNLDDEDFSNLGLNNYAGTIFGNLVTSIGSFFGKETPFSTNFGTIGQQIGRGVYGGPRGMGINSLSGRAIDSAVAAKTRNDNMQQARQDAINAGLDARAQQAAEAAANNWSYNGSDYGDSYTGEPSGSLASAPNNTEATGGEGGGNAGAGSDPGGGAAGSPF